MIRIYQIPLCFSTITDTYSQNEASPWYYSAMAGALRIDQVNGVETFARGVIDEHKLDVSQLFTEFALNARQYL